MQPALHGGDLQLRLWSRRSFRRHLTMLHRAAIQRYGRCGKACGLWVKTLIESLLMIGRSPEFAQRVTVFTTLTDHAPRPEHPIQKHPVSRVGHPGANCDG